MRINASCKTGFVATHQSGSRPLSAVTLIVMHDTEGGTARSVAEYFTSPNSGGSAHLVVDNDECYRCLANGVIPWGAPGANNQGFHIEQCGYARWTPAQWNRNIRMLRRAAYKTAAHCKKFGIPVRFVTATGLEAGHSGITTHAEVSKWQKAIGTPGDHSHTDPGPNWPRKVFMGLVRTYRARLR